MADLVSVVIPVYNTNDRFKACFESVLKQKYQNIEVILVDDGSSDASAQICDTIVLTTVNFPVTVIHKPNSGVSRARNLGIDFANGKYLVFIDSDDQVTPSYISDFMETRNKHLDVGHIWCGFLHCAEKKTIYVYTENEDISFLSRDDYLILNEKVMTQAPWQRLYDVSVLKNNNIKMLENLSLAEDAIFNLEYLDAVQSIKICIINKDNYLYYDQNNNSLQNKYRDDLYEIITLYLKTLEQYLQKWGITETDSFSKYYHIVFFKYLGILENTFKANNKLSFAKKIKYNNSVLCDQLFIDTIARIDIPISDRLKRAYQTKNYFGVWLYEHLASLYSRIKGRRN